MTILERIMEQLQVREMHEIPSAMQKTLLDDNKRNDFLDTLEPYYSYDAILAEFEKHSADRKNYMQDYTPRCILDIVAGITPIGRKVRDMCAGIGGLSLAKYERNPNIQLHLEEYSKNAIAFLLLNLLINKIGGAIVNEKNVLTGEVFQRYAVNSPVAGCKWGRVSKLEDGISDDMYAIDTVVSNPPYSQSWNPIHSDVFNGFKLPPKSKADYAFVLNGLHSLDSNGTAVFILPHGVLFRGQAEGDIRRELIRRNWLDTVIGLPEKLFTNTDIPVCILLFRKNRTHDDVLFIDVQKDFEKLKSKNTMTAEHIRKVIDTCLQRTEIDAYSRRVRVNEIIDNDYNLNIPRYVDSFEPEPIPDAIELAKELNQINDESRKVGLELLTILKELVCTNPINAKEHEEFVSEFEKFLTSADGAVTVAEQEAVVAKLQEVKRYLLNKMFV